MSVRGRGFALRLGVAVMFLSARSVYGPIRDDFFCFEKSVDHAQIATRNRINHLLSRFTFVAR